MQYLDLNTYIKAAYDPSQKNITAWEKAYQRYEKAFSEIRSYFSDEFLHFYDQTQMHDSLLSRIEICMEELLMTPVIKIHWMNNASRGKFCIVYHDVLDFHCSNMDFTNNEMANYLFGEILLSKHIFSHEFVLGNEVEINIHCRWLEFVMDI